MTKQLSITTLIIAGGPLASASTPSQSRMIKLSNRQLRRSDASAQTLLRNARPHKLSSNPNSRHLYQNFQPDGSYNIQFSQCVDVKLFDGDLFGEDVVAYSRNGQLVSTKSYVLFHVCQEEDCYYESEDDLYLVDLQTYLASVGLYHVNARNDYCEACAEFEDYCQQGDDDAAADDAANADGDDAAAAYGYNDDAGNAYNDDANYYGGRRNLNVSSQTARRTSSNLIDCDQCAAYDCYSQTDDFAAQQQLDNDVSDWIAQLAACQNTGSQWNGMDLYVGAMCSPYGDGVELAVFVDQDCTAYTNQFTYKERYEMAIIRAQLDRYDAHRVYAIFDSAAVDSESSGDIASSLSSTVGHFLRSALGLGAGLDGSLASTAPGPFSDEARRAMVFLFVKCDALLFSIIVKFAYD